eukprot:SAG11_NODE_1310_length_5236_cov_2.603270_2_plen_85_part_00
MQPSCCCRYELDCAITSNVRAWGSRYTVLLVVSCLVERKTEAIHREMESEKAGRLSVEAAQQHTRDAWIEEKRSRIAVRPFACN